MNLKACTLLCRVILGSAKGKDHIESIFTPGCAAPPTVRAGMMDEQNRYSLTPQFEQPVLHGYPSIAGTLASIRAERRKIIEDDQVNVLPSRPETNGCLLGRTGLSLSGNSGHGAIFGAQRSVANDPKMG